MFKNKSVSYIFKHKQKKLKNYMVFILYIHTKHKTQKMSNTMKRKYIPPTPSSPSPRSKDMFTNENDILFPELVHKPPLPTQLPTQQHQQHQQYSEKVKTHPSEMSSFSSSSTNKHKGRFNQYKIWVSHMYKDLDLNDDVSSHTNDDSFDEDYYYLN